MAPRKRLPSKKSNQTIQQSQHPKFGIQHFFERHTQPNCTVSTPQNPKSNPSPYVNTTENVATAAIAKENSSPISPEITKSVPHKRFKFSPGMLIKQSQDDGGDEITWKISPVNERLKSLTSKQLPGMLKIFADHLRPMASGLHACSGNQISFCSVGKLEKWISSPTTIPTDKSLVSSRKVPIPESEVGNSQGSNCECNSLVLEYKSPFRTPPSLPYGTNQLTTGATANGVSDQLATRQHRKDQVEDAIAEYLEHNTLNLTGDDASVNGKLHIENEANQVNGVDTPKSIDHDWKDENFLDNGQLAKICYLHSNRWRTRNLLQKRSSYGFSDIQVPRSQAQRIQYVPHMNSPIENFG